MGPHREPAGQERPGRVQVFVHVDVDDFQTAILILDGEVFQKLQVLRGLRAGARPEVDGHQLAAQILQVEHAVVAAFRGEEERQLQMHRLAAQTQPRQRTARFAATGWPAKLSAR